MKNEKGRMKKIRAGRAYQPPAKLTYLPEDLPELITRKLPDYNSFTR